ncbi:MAG: hypothetical protein EOP51_06135 [Sphingobacteriales bacterium]|nr:MAG: hypothetical protein EOP51_06135 [Sphingobacteriales bacterium]
MAKDAANDIGYYLAVENQHKDLLFQIRQWNDLKVGFEAENIWVAGFDYAQINSLEVKSIPYKQVFYESEGKLFLMGSLLPSRAVPSVLWADIERALPVTLPSFNHNYFGLNEMVQVSLVPSNEEKEAVAMITSIALLKGYIMTAPQVRLQKIGWVLLNNDQALLMGTPQLPINGETHWLHGNFLLPTGYDLDLHMLGDIMHELIDPENEHWIVWNTDNTYFAVDKYDVQQLSLGSFKMTLQKIEAGNGL